MKREDGEHHSVDNSPRKISDCVLSSRQSSLPPSPTPERDERSDHVEQNLSDPNVASTTCNPQVTVEGALTPPRNNDQHQHQLHEPRDHAHTDTIHQSLPRQKQCRRRSNAQDHLPHLQQMRRPSMDIMEEESRESLAHDTVATDVPQKCNSFQRRQWRHGISLGDSSEIASQSPLTQQEIVNIVTRATCEVRTKNNKNQSLTWHQAMNLTLLKTLDQLKQQNAESVDRQVFFFHAHFRICS